jgi:hypothetical protein
MKNILYAVIFILAQSQHSFAQDGSVSTKASDVRDQKKFGVYLGFGTPYPSLLGLNVGYNMSDLRITAGYAELEATTSLVYNNSTGWSEQKAKASSYDTGVEYYFMHGESWRPVAGVHVGYVDISGKGGISIQGFKKDTVHAYANAGIDYMSQGGYQFGVGYNQGFVSNGDGSIYLNTGRFF